jgi:hypothetical protein
MTRVDGVAEALAVMASRAVTSVFAAYGVPLQEVPKTAAAGQSIVALARQAALEAPTVGATIAFFGPKLQGELMLASTFDVIARTRPPTARGVLSPQSAASHIMVRDWIGELANQILGRFKTQLRRSALSFETRTPVPLSGHAVTLMRPKGADTRGVLFRAGGGGGVSFWFDVFCEAEVDLSAALTEGARDGELILL